MRTIYIFWVSIFLFCANNLSAQYSGNFITGGNTMHFRQQQFLFNPAAREPENKRTVTAALNSTNAKFWDRSAAANAFAAYHHPVKNSLFGFVFNKYFYQYSGLNTTEAGLSYNYNFKLDEKSSLSAGTQLSLKHITFRNIWIIYPDDYFSVSKLVPDLHAGLWFNREEFYAGVSVKNVLQPKVRAEKKYGAYVDYKMPAVSYLSTGYTFFHDRKFELKSALLVGTDLSKTVIDVNNTVYYKKKYSFGASMQFERINILAFNAGAVIDEKVELSVAVDPFRSDKFFSKIDIEGGAPAVELLCKVKF